MLFNSLEYIFIFLPSALILYFILNGVGLIRTSKALLVLASLGFYAYWRLDYLWILICSIVINYALGERLRVAGKGSLKGRSILWLAISLNLGLLVYYKYTGFILSNLNAITGQEFGAISLILPLGISFFTFQQIEYLVDSYSGERTSREPFVNYALFVSFFPQLIAGPIVNHKEMLAQFRSKDNMSPEFRNLILGIYVFVIGLFKKVVIADNLSPIVHSGFDLAGTLTLFEAWIASLSYTFQLYFDFSGYSDMAIGAALLFNYKLPINFNSPYKALDIQDFWRRWHITLGRFLRDYLYIPLGGNRNGAARTYLNIIITFLLCGFWHGAGWTFIAWGAMHGLAIAAHRAWNGFGLRMSRALAWALTFVFVNFSWVVFRATNFGDAWKVIKGMLGMSGVVMPSMVQGVLSWLWGSDMVFVSYFDNLGYNAALLYVMFMLMLVLVAARNSMERMQRFDFRVSEAFILSASVACVSIFFMTPAEFLYFNF